MKPAAPAQPPADADPRPRHPLEDAEDLLGAAPSPRVRKAILAAAAQAIEPAGLAPGARTSQPSTGPWRRMAARVAGRPALPVALAMATGIFAVALSVQIAPEHPVEAGTRVPAAPAVRSESLAGPSITGENKVAPSDPDTLPQTFVPSAQGGAARPEMTPTPSAKARAVPGSPPPSSNSMMMASPHTTDARSALAAPAAMSPEPLPAPVVTNRLGPPPPAAHVAPQTDLADQVVRTRAAPESGAMGAGLDAPVDPQQRMADPSNWMREIIRLRRSHQDEVADRQLAEFRHRYPDFVVPPEARRD